MPKFSVSLTSYSGREEMDTQDPIPLVAFDLEHAQIEAAYIREEYRAFVAHIHQKDVSGTIVVD